MVAHVPHVVFIVTAQHACVNAVYSISQRLQLLLLLFLSVSNSARTKFYHHIILTSRLVCRIRVRKYTHARIGLPVENNARDYA